MGFEIYLNFNGNCREAVEFYAGAFGAEMQPVMTYGDAPSDPEFPVAKDMENLIMHTFLIIKGTRIMLSDVPPGMPVTVGNNISLVVIGGSKEEIQAMFNRLMDGGKIEMELQETFWSKCYGNLTDKFGISWQLSLKEE